MAADLTHPPLRSFGRIKARPLKPRQATLLETLLPRIALPDSGPILLEGPTVLEIGFGGGERLVAQAREEPEVRFIGVEPFLNGVASCVRHIEAARVENVRLHQGDARDVLARLPDGGVSQAYVLFPDPWPKTRHWKRRLIQPAFVAALARVVRPGGVVRFATDWTHYAAWTLAMFHNEPAFAWTAERAADWRQPWPGHFPTRYELKGLGDCAPIYLQFERLSPI
jgi:tRNA (guanine-N7-)-methyltransferase